MRMNAVRKVHCRVCCVQHLIFARRGKLQVLQVVCSSQANVWIALLVLAAKAQTMQPPAKQPDCANCWTQLVAVLYEAQQTARHAISICFPHIITGVYFAAALLEPKQSGKSNLSSSSVGARQ